MDTKHTEGGRDRPRRTIRNKRYTRRVFGDDKRPPKRLFTPEIKRFLKDWLIRRRENPYPNRDEKKILAIQTGLTYIQVCNWFANWRRKLKNAGKEPPQRKTWGDLIKTYNSQVHGNVEHFSICSDDSIWEEQDNNYATQIEHCYNENNFVSSTTRNDTNESIQLPFIQPVNKYKNHIMEKYLRDCRRPNHDNVDDTAPPPTTTTTTTKPSMISKWLESAANFRPNENNYLYWSLPKCQKKKKRPTNIEQIYRIHGREELDAAEALTRLANSRNFVL